jgi:hypothetical protein
MSRCLGLIVLVLLALKSPVGCSGPPNTSDAVRECKTIKGGEVICGDIKNWREGMSLLDVMLDLLVSGNIAFNTPDRIPLGQSKIIEAKLSINMPPSALLKELNEAGAKLKGFVYEHMAAYGLTPARRGATDGGQHRQATGHNVIRVTVG